MSRLTIDVRGWRDFSALPSGGERRRSRQEFQNAVNAILRENSGGKLDAADYYGIINRAYQIGDSPERVAHAILASVGGRLRRESHDSPEVFHHVMTAATNPQAAEVLRHGTKALYHLMQLHAKSSPSGLSDYARTAAKQLRDKLGKFKTA